MTSLNTTGPVPPNSAPLSLFDLCMQHAPDVTRGTLGMLRWCMLLDGRLGVVRSAQPDALATARAGKPPSGWSLVPGYDGPCLALDPALLASVHPALQKQLLTVAAHRRTTCADRYLVRTILWANIALLCAPHRHLDTTGPCIGFVHTITEPEVVMDDGTYLLIHADLFLLQRDLVVGNCTVTTPPFVTAVRTDDISLSWSDLERVAPGARVRFDTAVALGLPPNAVLQMTGGVSSLPATALELPNACAW